MTRVFAGIAAGALAVTVLASCASGLGADPSADDLRREFGGCSLGGRVEGQPSREFLVDYVGEWRELASVVRAEREPGPDGGRGLASQVRTDDGDLTIEIHPSYWPGLDWAIAHKARVWLGMPDPKAAGQEDVVSAAVVLIETPDGEVFFPGECQDQILDSPLHELLGVDADAILAKIPLVDDETARDLLGMETPEPSASAPVILNPQDAPQELLDSLDQVRLYVRITQGIARDESGPALCSHIDEGWGDCLTTTDNLVDGDDVFAYLNDTRSLELWLLDRADTTKPIGWLGTLDVPADARSVHVEIDTAGLDLDSLPQKATASDPGVLKVTFER